MTLYHCAQTPISTSCICKLPALPTVNRKFWKARAKSLCTSQGHSDHPLEASDPLSTVHRKQAEASDRPPRFYLPHLLPVRAGAIVKLDEAESKHALKSLRLRPGASIELCDGEGGKVLAKISNVHRNEASVELLAAPTKVEWTGPKLELVVACGSLLQSRADWMVEKAAELNAYSIKPLVTERSEDITRGRLERWRRVATAATKQSLRLHSVKIHEPIMLRDFAPNLASFDFALLAAAGGLPLYDVLPTIRGRRRGALIVGPQGDFSPSEIDLMTGFGAVLVGLGDNRLRVETAVLAMLATTQLSLGGQ